jgi:uncharacterized protein (TIGR03067 family)
MTTLATVGTLAGLLVLQAAGEPEATRKDRDRLQGKWKVIAAQSKGEKVATKDLADLFLVFEDDGIQVVENKKTQVKYTYRLHAQDKPKQIDFTYTTGPKKGRTDRGIYRFQGERLTFCIQEDGAQPRPTEFATAADTALFLIVLERVQP